MHSKMYYCSFFESNIKYCNFSFATFNSISFVDTTIKLTDFNNIETYETGFSGAILVKIEFKNSMMKGTQFIETNIKESDFSFANIHSCNFMNGKLEHVLFYATNCESTIFNSAKLSSINFSNADLRNVDFKKSVIKNHKVNENTVGFAMACPEEGSFIGYKRASDKIIVLKIMADAKRSSATSLKCRCSKAKVLRIEEMDGSISEKKSISSNYDYNFIYNVGKIISVHDFDENRWHECAPGIHFFMNKEMAKQYT